ncbi:MAG: hypothetical protein V1662_03120, partial [Candidatus Omnitrophota bacterium]
MGNKRVKEDNSWVWLLSITGVVTVLFTVWTISAGFRRPVSGNNISVPESKSAADSALMSRDSFSPPVLKSLMVNPDSKTNYFDFILDTGDSGLADEEQLNPLSGELINYFFLGITLPSEDFWVNLNPVELNKITSPRLVYTDMGKALLETDLRLKKDAALLTDPRIPAGKQYWSILNQKLRENNLSNYQIPANTRLWIVPEEAVLEEEGNKVTLISAKLKVCLESEYLPGQTADNNVTVFAGQESEGQKMQDIAFSAMKEAIIPVIEYRVNNSKDYAQLRQVYHSLILAEYFKHKYWGRQSIYESYINTGSLSGLETKSPWDKRTIFDSYIKSINRGEYSFYQDEYDPYQLAMVKKHYFSGGMQFAGLSQGFAGSPIVLEDAASSGVLAGEEGEWLVKAVTDELNPLQLQQVQVEKAIAQKIAASPIILPGQDARGSKTEEDLNTAEKLVIPGGRQEISEPEKGRTIATIFDPVRRRYIDIVATEKLEKIGDLWVPKMDVHIQDREVVNDEIKTRIEEEQNAELQLAEIEGLDRKTLEFTDQFVRKNHFILLQEGVNIDKLLMSYFSKLGGFSEDELQTIENLLSIRTFSEAKNAQKVYGKTIGRVIETLNYFLHPDIFVLFLDNGRRGELLDLYLSLMLLSEEQDTLQLHKRVDLLITLLAKGYPGKVRDKIKSLLRHFDLTVFGQEDLLRLKYIMLKRGERPEEFLNEPGEALSLWEKDDQEKMNWILPKIETLQVLSPGEWQRVVQEAGKIGSSVFYRGEIDKLAAFQEDDTTGIEIEYDENRKEVRIPARYEGNGFKNTRQEWEKVKERLDNFGGTSKLGDIHIHTDRHSQELTPESEEALMRLVVTYDAIFSLFSESELDPEQVNSYAKSPEIDAFFTGRRISTHTTYIDWSSAHDTIEFRFFAVPLYGSRERFDLDRLQLYVYLAKQVMRAVIERPEDFSILNAGLPVVLGMGNKLIPYNYISKFADNLFKGDLQGKLYFLKLLSPSVTQEGEISFRKLGDNWLDEDSVKKYFEENGFVFLAKMHLQHDRWDTYIYQNIRARVNLLKDRKDSAEYRELGRLLTTVFFSTINKKEKAFAETMLQELGYHIFLEKILQIVEGIENKQLQSDFVRYALPKILVASAQRSDEVVERILRIAEGIANKQLQRDFVGYALPEMLGASAQRSDEVFISFVEGILRIAEGIANKQLQHDFVWYALPEILGASAQRSDEVVEGILRIAEGIA